MTASDCARWRCATARALHKILSPPQRRPTRREVPPQRSRVQRPSPTRCRRTRPWRCKITGSRTRSGPCSSKGSRFSSKAAPRPRKSFGLIERFSEDLDLKIEAGGVTKLRPFVRHFEDAAQIARNTSTLPPLEDYTNVYMLVQDMLAQKQIAALPTATHEAFAPNNSKRWQAVRKAHTAIAPMFWGSSGGC